MTTTDPQSCSSGKDEFIMLCYLIIWTCSSLLQAAGRTDHDGGDEGQGGDDRAHPGPPSIGLSHDDRGGGCCRASSRRDTVLQLSLRMRPPLQARQGLYLQVRCYLQLEDQAGGRRAPAGQQLYTTPKPFFVVVVVKGTNKMQKDYAID